jgi:thioredoxin reductase
MTSKTIADYRGGEQPIVPATPQFSGCAIETEAPIRKVFLFVGADPATEWLQGCGVAVDNAGFMITGAHFGEGETTMRVIRAVAEMWQLLRAYSAAMNDIATTAR